MKNPAGDGKVGNEESALSGIMLRSNVSLPLVC
jgi:hypothetical protein